MDELHNLVQIECEIGATWFSKQQKSTPQEEYSAISSKEHKEEAAHNNTPTRHPLPVDRQTTQIATAQTGTTATARLSHLLYCPNESGTKAATPRYDTVTNATVSVDAIYDLRLAQPNKKKLDKEMAAVNTSQPASTTSSSRARSIPKAQRYASQQQQQQAAVPRPQNPSTSAASRRGEAARRAREGKLKQEQRLREQEQQRLKEQERRERQLERTRNEERVKEEERLEEQQRLKAEAEQAGEREAAQARAQAREERRLRRVKARRERATDAEAVKRQRLQMLAADMQNILHDDPDYDPDEPAIPQDASSSSRSGTNQASGNVREDVANATANDRSTAAKEEAIKKEEEEEEDDSSLCIVCMTEKRNACLVHGKTSHQIVCLPCGGRLKAAKMGCPVCKRPIQAVIENFTS